VISFDIPKMQNMFQEKLHFEKWFPPEGVMRILKTISKCWKDRELIFLKSARARSCGRGRKELQRMQVFVQFLRLGEMEAFGPLGAVRVLHGRTARLNRFLSLQKKGLPQGKRRQDLRDVRVRDAGAFFHVGRSPW
jgi:hypothetical protein